jgi:PAS domain S-box-containing protein
MSSSQATGPHAEDARLRILAAVTTATTGSGTHGERLRRIADVVVPALADWCIIDVVEADGRVRRVAVTHAAREDAPVAAALLGEHVSEPAPCPPVASAVATGRTELVPTIDDAWCAARAADPRHLGLLRAMRLRSGIAVPLIVGGRLAGVMTFATTTCSGRCYCEDDVQLFEEIGARATTASVHARLAEEVEHRVVERSRAAEALRASEERYRRLLGLVTSMVWTCDPWGAFVADQRAWSAYTGQTWEQYRDYGWLRAIHPDDRTRVREAWEAAFAAEREYFVTARVWHAGSGAYHHCEGRAVPLRDADGRLHEWIGMVVDVDDRLQAARALESSEQRLRIAAEAAQLGVFEWRGDDHRAVWENDRMYEIFGRTRDDGPLSHKKFIEQVLHPDDGEVFLRAFAEAATSRRLSLTCRILRTNDRALRWVDVAGRVEIGPPGSPVRLVGVVADVTDRRLAEQALAASEQALREADRRKDEFLAMLSHELRNPLAPIRNAVHLMRVLPSDASEVARVREVIARQVTHLTRLVDDLLEVTRITRGSITLQKRVVDLSDVVRDAVETSRPLLEQHRHRLSMSLAPEPIAIDADRTRLVQVIANLLGNAAKFTPPGGHVTVDTARDAAGRAVIRVADTGVGVSKEMQQRVFDAFVQDDATLARSRGGLGIGLTLVRRLVDLHGGRVTLESDGPGAGTTVTVTLPALASAAAAAEAGADIADPSAMPHGLRVLVVEDNVDAAESFAMLLEHAGHEVRAVHHGDDGLRLLGTFVPDVAFVDLGLPGLTGYEVARRLRADPRARSTVLIALTGYGRPEDKAEATAAGFDRHLTKPVDANALLSLLARLRTAGAANAKDGTPPDHRHAI